MNTEVKKAKVVNGLVCFNRLFKEDVISLKSIIMYKINPNNPKFNQAEIKLCGYVPIEPK